MFRASAAFVLMITFAQACGAAEYCLAIRGNGELEPAHWGAVSNVVERLGLPRAMAGGSSASITMFLLDAIAGNPQVRQAPLEAKAARAALLIKSLQGFAAYLAATQEFREFRLLYSEGRRIVNAGPLEDMEKILAEALARNPEKATKYVRENADALFGAYQAALKTGLLSKPALDTILQAFNRIWTVEDLASAMPDIRLTRFYVGELIQSLRVMGAFDAATDDNLFFRPGIVDFDQLAQQVGLIGGFYAAANVPVTEAQQWEQFVSRCSEPAAGHLWSELITAKPECGLAFHRLIQSHFAGRHDSFAMSLVGTYIPSFPTTAVLTGRAQAEVAQAFKVYNASLSPEFGRGFALSNPEDVRFGYWGDDPALSRIRENLPEGDAKSRRFFSLGRAPWAEVLSLSPAEPGLSRLKFFTHGPSTFVSAGGWSDLHPVQVLKAAGCESVVYVTRRGGESLFAQGVAKRLLSCSKANGPCDGYGRGWSELSTSGPEASGNVILNNKGDASDLSSLWSRLFNLANSKSSFRQALSAADAVLCTDWNAHKIQDGIEALVEDAYHAPFYVPASSRLESQLFSPQLDVKAMHADGYPQFAGCF